jgi:hypothetical protein
MSKKFNLDDYKGKYVMHCKTEEEAKDFCRVLHEAGKTWHDGELYLNNTAWRQYESLTCYRFSLGDYCHYHFYKLRCYTILEWSDFMNKEFTAEDLRNFDIVLTRDGDVRILIGSQLIDKHGYMMGPVSNYCCDLTYPFDPDKDIVAVRRSSTLEDMSFDAFEKKLGRLVYERDETVEMTLEEICKALGKNVKIVKGDK